MVFRTVVSWDRFPTCTTGCQFVVLLAVDTIWLFTTLLVSVGQMTFSTVEAQVRGATLFATVARFMAKAATLETLQSWVPRTHGRTASVNEKFSQRIDDTIVCR